MPSTRSQTKQSHIEDFVEEKAPTNAESPDKTQKSKNRGKDALNPTKAKQATIKTEESPTAEKKAAHPRSPEPAQDDPPAKRQKTTSKSPTAERKPTPKSPAKKSMSKQHAALAQGKDKDEKVETPQKDTSSNVIMINRAPVLDLWATTVTHFLYPDLPWITCLSAGSAISALCAVSKGRAVGLIDSKDEDGSKSKESQAKELEEISVMGFNLKLKENLVVVGNDKKPANEDAQKKKFGEQQYEKAKSAFQDALSSWDDDKDGLNKKAFHFYEQFRPTVAQGQKGWGRKGELVLDTVGEVVRKTA